MPNFKPLSYDSLRTVLWQMEPSLRITLSSRIPSLRITEAAIPLRIKNLRLSHCSISINDVTYTLGVTSFKKNPNNKWEVIRKYGKCTDSWDYTKYGFRMRPATLTPGDLKFQRIEMSEEMSENFALDRLDVYKRAVAERDSFWDSVTFIQKYQGFVDQCHEKRMGLEPSVKHFLHLAISKENGSAHEFIEYKQNLREALKHLNSKILGGRDDPIKVQNLIYIPKRCIRLPEKWSKLKVENLKAEKWKAESDNRHLKQIWKILAPSSFPLKSINIGRFFDDDLPMLKNAEKVVLPGFPYRPNTPLRRVHFHKHDFSKDDLLDTIRNWIEVGKEIGTCFTFDIKDSYIGRVIEWCETEDNVVVRKDAARNIENRFRYPIYPYNFIFPINYRSEISIHFDESQLLTFDTVRMILEVQSTENQEIEEPSQNSDVLPFSKNCQNAIIANMNPNFRLYLSQKCPDFSELEKLIPLKIENFSITSTSLIVNDTQYYLDFKYYKKTENGKFESSYLNKVDFDVDKFGIRIPHTLDSGHLDFGIQYEDLGIEELSSKLVELQKTLDEMKIEETEFDEDMSYDFSLMEEAENLREEIEKTQFKIHQLTLRNENLEPEFRYFVVLAVCDQFERIDTNGQFYSAQAYFFDKILGNRPGILKVKNLALKAENSLLKVPKNLKIQAKNFTVKGNKNGLKIFEPILTGFDFESIGLDMIQNSDLEILKKSKKIVLTSDFKEAQNLPPLPYKTVEFRYFSMEHFWKILKDWMDNVPELGTFFSFICTENDYYKPIEQISREGGSIGTFSETRFGPLTPCLIFPLNENLEINVFILRSKKSYQSDIYSYDNFHHVTEKFDHYNRIEMKVRRKGFATALEF